jgi:hypothetical protein
MQSILLQTSLCQVLLKVSDSLFRNVDYQ